MTWWYHTAKKKC